LSLGARSLAEKPQKCTKSAENCALSYTVFEPKTCQEWLFGCVSRLSIVGASGLVGMMLFYIVLILFSKGPLDMEMAGKIAMGVLLMSALALFLAGLIVGW
jgi:hypothetical protein